MPAKPASLREPKRSQWLIFIAVCAAGFVLFLHADVIETANHSYILLDSFFGGQFRSFYGNVAAHENAFYYINNAHYNIVVYLLFALAELPVYIINHIFDLAPNEAVLSFVGKLVSTAFFFASLPLVSAIGRMAGLSQRAAGWAPLFFALWPPAFFSVLAMGQYDSICVFLTLLAVYWWMQGKMLRFAIVFGVAIPFKIFAALLMVPLLLLREKRILQVLKYALISLWVLVPTGLLFAGHTFSMGQFTTEMTQRLFAASLPAARQLPVFALCYGLLCVLCYFWRPAEEKLPRLGLWLGLATYGLVFLFVEWHPQWLILLAPWAVLTTLLEKQHAAWLLVDILLCAGFFLVCAAAFPGQLEANLMDRGLPGLIAGATWQGTALIGTYTKLDVIGYLPTVLFSIPLAAHLLLKLPLPGGTPAGRLCAKTSPIPALESRPALALWLLFGIGFGLCWLAPVLLSRLGLI